MPTTLDVYRSGTGKVIRPGDAVKVDGLRGKFKVTGIREAGTGTIEITVYGGPAGKPKYRTATPERVHRKLVGS